MPVANWISPGRTPVVFRAEGFFPAPDTGDALSMYDWLQEGERITYLLTADTGDLPPGPTEMCLTVFEALGLDGEATPRAVRFMVALPENMWE